MKVKINSTASFLFFLLFVQNISAQLNVYPNELRGFLFFNKGKLKGVKLAVTTRDEVVKLFGKSCEESCDYDDKWTFHLFYFDHIEKRSNSLDSTAKYVPASRFSDKIYSITFRAKTNIQFDNVEFPSTFRKWQSSALFDVLNLEWYPKTAGISFLTYQDKSNLSYTFLQKIENKNGIETLESKQAKKAELTMIEYEIPAKIEEKMFIKEK